MDGFGDVTGYGFAYNNYLSFSHAGSLKDEKGNSESIFTTAKLDALVDLHQFLYTFKMPESAFAQPGINLIVPLVNLSADVKGSIPVGPGQFMPIELKDNGFGLGDITAGVYAQFKPITVEDHPIFSHRIGFNVIMPTGKYSSTKDFNPGTHAWHINPDWAITFIPAYRFEISTRIQYLYNFANNNPAADAAGPHTSTQSGMAIFDNFAAAFEILPFDPTRTGALNLRAGLNGYFFKQISDNKTDGVTTPNQKEQVLGLGPGAMWAIAETDALWLNVYFETAVQNRFASNTVQLRWAHAFSDF